MDTLIERAKRFASKAHNDIMQTRKFTYEPYIVHPEAVAEIVASVPHTPEMIVVAWLHDVVEDTPVTLAEVETEFGSDIARMVSELTYTSKQTDGNRKQRKALDLIHTSNASPEAKTIKLADLLDNLSSVIKHDREYAKLYFGEKALLIEVLHEGDSVLWNKVNELIQTSLKDLGV